MVNWSVLQTQTIKHTGASSMAEAEGTQVNRQMIGVLPRRRWGFPLMD